ncbi:hypothetical protein H5410_051701 [Solanum commersonii]|uniref:Uncharacterized protein n=1 Tax=Solanum commersonii TaxID=4109 RepID=A0A9J5WZ79_SOLCO|nr:hypothetical protein H5410_051701 [Solanum commersonii]
MKHSLKEHVEALLGLKPAFLEPVWDDVPIDEDKRRTMSDSEFDSDVEESDHLALEGTGGYLDKGRKIEDKVAEKNGQEAGKYTRREQWNKYHLTVQCASRARCGEDPFMHKLRRRSRSASRTWTPEFSHF